MFKNLNKDNSDVFYTDKYQGHIACSYVYEVVWIDNRFSKPVQINQGESAL